MKHHPETVEILWTGGFDSTFRIVQLSQLDVEIQPYYLSYKIRKSTQYELKAIEDITFLLLSNPKTRCRFKPLISVEIQDYIEDKEITAAYHSLREKDFLGTQYEGLARFGKLHPGIELSVHQDDKAILLINKYGKLKKENTGTPLETFVLDSESSSEDLYTIFGNYHLPLAEYTKLQMKEYFIHNGYADIMNKTWFCHRPLLGKPCGFCNPCIYTIEEGMKERLPHSAMIRYHLIKMKPVRKVYRILQKLYRG